MLEKAITISLQITAIFVLFQQGSLLGFVRIYFANLIDKNFGKIKSVYIQKPVFGCLFCMSSLWTCLLTLSLDIHLIFTVCGINFLIYKFIDDDF